MITILLELPTTPDVGVLQKIGSLSYETAEDLGKRLGAQKWDFRLDFRP